VTPVNSHLKQDDNLFPGAYSLQIAIALTVVYFVLPPIYTRSTFGLGAILYFTIRDWKAGTENELGLGFKLSKQAKRWVIALLLAIFFMTPILMYGGRWVFKTALDKMNIPADSYVQPMLEGRVLPLHPDSTFYKALERKDLATVTARAFGNLVYLGIIIPSLETVIVIGMMVTAISRKWSYKLAVFIVPTIFAGMHLTFYRFPIFFAFGLIMVLLYWKTRSIYPSVLFHAFVNTTAYLVSLAIRWGFLAP
jgi:membrane protease YdiL (CAAX protease family)